jgi:NYN domain
MTVMTLMTMTVIANIWRRDLTPNVAIFIDGPNFINRLLDMKIDNDLISQQLTLDGFRREVKRELEELGRLEGECDTVEFVCSEKMFGSDQSKFTREERELLLGRLGAEPGVHVERVHLPGKDEKGVDGTVATGIENFMDHNSAAVLVSADRDFVPLLRRMRERGKKVVTVALNDHYPPELTNESYFTLSLGDQHAAFFEYAYPRCNIEDLDYENMRRMIANADDRMFKRVQITKGGQVSIARWEWSVPEERPGVKFSFETFAPGNDYAGPRAASDEGHVNEYLEDIHKAWRRGAHGHIDYPLDILWPAEKDE